MEWYNIIHLKVYTKSAQKPKLSYEWMLYKCEKGPKSFVHFICLKLSWTSSTLPNGQDPLIAEPEHFIPCQ